MNLQDAADGDGTHWIGFVVKEKKIVYFDSYGLYPPRIVRKIASRIGLDRVDYQDEILQTTSQRCGWFVLYFVKWLQDQKKFSGVNPSNFSEEAIESFQRHVSG